MVFMYILSWLALILQVVFVTISIVAGLYYIAELVEEYTTAARKVILFMISFTMFVYTMFIFCDDLPWRMVIMGFVTQAFHLAIMGNFPFIKFLSIPFIGSVVCLILNHFLAFQYFTSFYYPFTQIEALRSCVLTCPSDIPKYALVAILTNSPVSTTPAIISKSRLTSGQL
ncbi:hypothetical protein GQX74_012113 [Glossina fuscipes]|nr:hypothetical protein GQX74_012113 [Glossina fuscipes]